MLIGRIDRSSLIQNLSVLLSDREIPSLNLYVTFPCGIVRSLVSCYANFRSKQSKSIPSLSECNDFHDDPTEW